MASNFQPNFSGVTDPRVSSRCSHLLEDILFIAFCTLLSNGEDFEDMVEFGHQRLDWLQEVLELPNGIPSHDTFNRVLPMIDPEQLSLCLAQDGEHLVARVAGKLINLDGKKVGGVSPGSRGNQGLFILSAWFGEDRLCLGQQKVQHKRNEITAIPQLLHVLDLQGSVVSTDAIGCQSEIAAKIIEAKADDLLALKKNQGDLYDQVHDELLWKQAQSFDETWDCDHGRDEGRKCQVIPAHEILSPQTLEKWQGINALIRGDAQRHIGDKTHSQTRFYISSQSNEPAFYNQATRGHWSIENHLHWHLDITFNEDASRSRKANAPLNLNILRKMARHRLTRMNDKLSLKKRRFRASMNEEYLQMVLGISV